MADYTVSESDVVGGFADVELTGTTKGMKRRLMIIGGGVLIELKRRINGAGSTGVTIPQYFFWCHADQAYSGVIDEDVRYSVIIIDVGQAVTVETIRAILDP